MGKVVYSNGTGVPHKSFEEEFLTHKKCSEWWYSTGYFKTEDGMLYSFQYTLANVKIYGITVTLQLNAITDIKNKRHYFSQKPYFFKKGIETNQTLTSAKDMGRIKYQANQYCSFGKMDMQFLGKNYQLNLQLNATKPPVWHCDDGKLEMGYLNNPKEVTYYYSLTNLELEGEFILAGKKQKVKGKAWFDRQGGTYNIIDPKCNWEWFSLRFNNNEEMMLFTFPQTNHQDGTYIHKDGSYERLNNYKITHHQIIEASGFKWSYGWTLELFGESPHTYEIIPMAEGQLNLYFFELLAEIINENNEVVGYCVVELLPGARNNKVSKMGVFRSVH